MQSKDLIQKAHAAAIEVQSRAHAPYSRYKVGAAYKDRNHLDFFVGCNVENASFGATVCAERNALCSAVARLGRLEPEFLMLVTDSQPAACPCGLCLQVLTEFAGRDFPIFLANQRGLDRSVTLGELISTPFDGRQLLK